MILLALLLITLQYGVSDADSLVGSKTAVQGVKGGLSVTTRLVPAAAAGQQHHDLGVPLAVVGRTSPSARKQHCGGTPCRSSSTLKKTMLNYRRSSSLFGRVWSAVLDNILDNDDAKTILASTFIHDQTMMQKLTQRYGNFRNKPSSLSNGNKNDSVSAQDAEPLITAAAMSSSITTAASFPDRNPQYGYHVDSDDLQIIPEQAIDDFIPIEDLFLRQKRPVTTTIPSATMQALEIEIPRGGATTISGDASKLKPIAAAAAHGPIISILYSLGSWIGETSGRCWTALMISIAIEIAATTMTKQASDIGSVSKMIFAMALYVTSLLGFAASLPKIDVSIAYAVWSALGTAFVSAAGIMLFGEKCDRLKIASILMIMAGVVGLNMSEDGGHH